MNLRWLDLIDILLITFVVYQLYSLFYRTKGFRILIGFLGLGIIYALVKSWGLFLSTLVFQIFWQALIFLIIIVFQPEIREVLEKINLLNLFQSKKSLSSPSTVEAIVRAVFRMSGEKIGALIVFRQQDDLKNLIRDGLPLDGEISEPILLSIFQKPSPVHDGAILIDEDRIKIVAGYLPMTERDNLPNKYGSRHRASLGLSEKSDAFLVVVSEERGDVSVIQHGKVHRAHTPQELSDYIQEHISRKQKKVRLNLRALCEKLFIESWVKKLVTFALVFLFYTMLAGQQNYSQNLLIPIEYNKIPSQMELISPPKSAKIVIKGLRKLVASLKTDELHVDLDVSLSQWGRRTFYISEENINLPGGIQLEYVEPSAIRLDFR